MFLKRIEMQGFKSFADKTVITFNDSVTGIVGPNGCGKSNISDAVRWVLGEQSAKQMRGERMNDVIFAGSTDRRMLNMAEVTLVFDNTNHILNSETEEIEITRRLFRDSGDAEYMINRKNVRLKDIVELFLDTGLGKDSLSIIGQGNIISFAEAKPIERRGIFEEAAGVAKYKKRKLESLSRLERTKSNLDRSNDILAELEKQVAPLKRQAHKAEIYREKKQRLHDIEVSVLVQEINALTNQRETLEKKLFDIETNSAMLDTAIQVGENQVENGRKTISSLDKDINALQEQLMETVNDIARLEAQKAEMDERRKYIMETGNREQKIKETRSALETARVEYEDRSNRFERIQTDIKLNSEKLSIAAQNLFDTNNDYEQAEGILRSLQNRKTYLDNMIRDPFTAGHQAGIKSIMDHKQALPGILGVIGQVIKANPGYENAISEALGGAMYNIVTIDEQSARTAIRFLKKNQSGRATFIPLTVCRPRRVAKDIAFICENTAGYLGIASDFVTMDDQYLPIVENLLQNVLVVDNLENGNNLSNLINHGYKICTLDGEVIHRGGSMTGGKNRHSTTLVTMTNEASQIAQSIDAQSARVQLAHQKAEDARNERESIARLLQQLRIEAASLEPVVDAKKAKFEKLQNDLALLKPEEVEQGLSQDNEGEELIVRLNHYYLVRDEVTARIKSSRQERLTASQDTERKEFQLRQLRKEKNTVINDANEIRVEQGKLETRLDTNLQRLASEYQLTYEYASLNVSEVELESARQEVALLRSEIDRLGNVNMNAPEEYEEVNERYEFMLKQIQELTDSRNKILSAIDEMDTIMTKQFKEMFDKINAEFNDIFRHMYGGGKAKLILQDPNDLLNTGIDIDAQPPGKAVQNNMLFSGGEKSMIALCVLFAILKVKAVPLVILDEVEAALDQANVERFARYLHHYTDTTQFIVVTHRPGTMENCDVLYGVTMQHQGVSQMLKVELRDAVDMTNNESGGTA